MKTYFAIQCGSNSGTTGSLFACTHWARKQVKKTRAPIQILKARAGERDAIVIAEIGTTRERWIRNSGLVVRTKALLRHHGA